MDVIDKVSPADVKKLAATPGVSLFAYPGLRALLIQPSFREGPNEFIRDNQGRPLAENPLRDVRVRQALSLAINRKAIVERILQNTVTEANQWMPANTFGYNPQVKNIANDPAQAKKLLAEAGYPDGFQLTVHVPGDRYPLAPETLQAVAQFWARIGVKVDLQVVPWSVYASRANKNEYAVTVIAWGNGTGEASYGLTNVLASADAGKGLGSSNWGALQQSVGRPGAGAGFVRVRRWQARGDPASFGDAGDGRCGRVAAVPLPEYLGGAQRAAGRSAAQRPHHGDDGQRGKKVMATLHITPADGLLDEPRQIVVEGLAAGQQVTLSSQTRRGGEHLWRSSATFVADARGRVDLDQHAPLAGDYSGVSAMGLLWSQRAGQGRSTAVFNDSVLQPLLTEIRLEGSDQMQTLIQRLAGEGVSRREIRENGLVGTLFVPAGPGPHPAVMVLNGSGGGIERSPCCALCLAGLQRAGTGLFQGVGAVGLHLQHSAGIFRARPGMDAPRTGAGRWLYRPQWPVPGGELVLLLGSLFPRSVAAVIGYVPSALVHGGQAAADPAVGRDGPAWLYRGQPLVHVWNNNRHASWAARDAGLRNALSISTALQDAQAVERARIAVEQIRGPVLLLTAGDDAAWPSSRFRADGL